MFASPEKIHKLLVKVLEMHTPHDWRYIGETFRMSLWDEGMIDNMRSFVIGFSVADSERRGLHRMDMDDRIES